MTILPLRTLALVVLLTLGTTSAFSQAKREFRGAWIQAVNAQFMGMSREDMQATLTRQLDALEREGVNAIIFQVRVECDALYLSSLEPWSRFLTGTQGKNPGWDPLAWMVRECHRRNMEIHAWINPYRAKVKDYDTLCQSHICVRRPECFFKYDGLYILNPGMPENSDYICNIARDIVTRYDIDGFHIDDYFYPYPVAGKTIPDGKQFEENNPAGITNIADWRRENVSRFVRQLYETIHEVKPWVKFGVSPFGIYRNKKSDPRVGSATNGLQNYDDLYADVLLWVNNGWVDYCVPQLYWEIGNRVADYDTLIRWWNKYCAARPLYIGESIENTLKYRDPRNKNANQMDAKFRLHNEMPAVCGTVLWYARLAAEDKGNFGTLLSKKYWAHPALQPSMPFIDSTRPARVRDLRSFWTEDGYVLFWNAPKGDDWRTKAQKYVVYRFSHKEKIDVDDPSKIVAITDKTYYELPYVDGKTSYTYVVTALDRLQNESEEVKKKVKL